MSDPRVPKLVYFLMLLIGLLEWTHAYPQLPDRMASHFDIYGRPDGWQPKEAIGFLLPRVCPGAIIGWRLTGAKKRSAFFGAASRGLPAVRCSVLLYAASEAINANLPDHGPFLAGGMLYVLAGFLLVTAAGTVELFRHFS
jgi:uncharacterized membrane protein